MINSIKKVIPIQVKNKIKSFVDRLDWVRGYKKYPFLILGKGASKIFDILHSYQYDIYRFNLDKMCFEDPVSDADNGFDNYYVFKN